MFKVHVTRRAALAPFGAFALVPTVSAHSAFARRLAQPGGIRVDVTPLRENAGDPTATWVEQALPAALARTMAGRVPSGGLTVRVEYLTLGPNSGQPVNGGRSIDNISGVAIVGSAQIPVRATTTYWPSASDQTMIDQSNHDRVALLAQALADWLPSYL